MLHNIGHKYIAEMSDKLFWEFHAIVKTSHELVELVEQQPATRCMVGSIPAGSALEVWPWTSVLTSLAG
jgi:hypothetical protein